MLRWLGIRAVPHLPCSFSCQESIKLGADFVELGIVPSFKPEMDWLSEMLYWPVEWSVLHGIAEIRILVVKIATCTDATAEKYTILYHDSKYLEKRAKGLSFTYRQQEGR